MTPDYPEIRAGHTCPLCALHKERGLVVCWDCYRKHDFRNGESPAITARLQRTEARLKMLFNGGKSQC